MNKNLRPAKKVVRQLIRFILFMPLAFGLVANSACGSKTGFQGSNSKQQARSADQVGSRKEKRRVLKPVHVGAQNNSSLESANDGERSNSAGEDNRNLDSANSALDTLDKSTEEDKGLNPDVNSDALERFQELALTCETSKKETLGISGSPEKLHLKLKPTCEYEWTEIEIIEQRKMDIVILLDVTGSMRRYIDVIKTNLVDFANKMTDKGWDAKFALVAYRDQITKKTVFKSASEISNELKKQEASGGKSPAEAGFLGVKESLKILNVHKRPESVPALLMVTDAPSWINNQRDFNIGTWQQFIRDSLNVVELKGLQFYSSVGNRIKDRSSPTAAEQIRQLRNKTDIVGKDLEFPFSEDVLLNSLIVSIQEISKDLKVECPIKNVKVYDSDVAFDQSNPDSFLSVVNLNSDQAELEVKVERTCDGNIKVENFSVKIDRE